MKPIPASLAATLLAVALAAAPLHAAPDLQVRQSGAISYVSGGISEESRDGLLAMGREFNLKVVMATRSGAYLSDVGIVVNDARGQPVLDTRADGPWLLARLPAGQYTIEATAEGKTVRKPVNIGTQPQTQVDLRWDE